MDIGVDLQKVLKGLKHLLIYDFHINLVWRFECIGEASGCMSPSQNIGRGLKPLDPHKLPICPWNKLIIRQLFMAVAQNSRSDQL